MRVLVLLAVLAVTPARAAADDEPRHALGARIRGAWLTNAMLKSVMAAATEMNGLSGAVEYVYRQRRYDVVTSLDLTMLGMRDGNYLARGRDPSQDVHYVQFGGFGQLNLLSVDVSIIGHNDLTRWLEVRYGGGVGLGLLLGDIRLIANSRMCTAENAHDPSRCYPVSPTVGPIRPDDPQLEQKLAATEDPNKVDVADDPHRHVTQDKPPVLPVLNLVVGLRFKVHRHVAFDLEVGFRNAIFFGAGMKVPF
jgi:hypothetical protein